MMKFGWRLRLREYSHSSILHKQVITFSIFILIFSKLLRGYTIIILIFSKHFFLNLLGHTVTTSWVVGETISKLFYMVNEMMKFRQIFMCE